MRNKIIFICLLALIILPMVSAIDTDYTFKQNSKIDLKRPCINNGTWCSDLSVCNMTITAPDNTLIADNRLMTNQGSYHNYTLSQSNNILIGIYKADMICIDGDTGSDTFYYEVTPSGNNHDSLGLYIILFVLAYGLTFSNAYLENIPLTVIGGFAMMILGIYTLNNGIDVYRNFATEAFSYITIFIGGYFGVTGGMRFFENE